MGCNCDSITFLLFVFGRLTTYVIFHTGNYGAWNDCMNTLRYETHQEYNIIEDSVIKRCGVQPTMPARELNSAINIIENFMFDGFLQMFIPFGQFQKSIIFILICYFIGFYIDKKRE